MSNYTAGVYSYMAPPRWDGRPTYRSKYTSCGSRVVPQLPRGRTISYSMSLVSRKYLQCGEWFSNATTSMRRKVRPQSVCHRRLPCCAITRLKIPDKWIQSLTIARWRPPSPAIPPPRRFPFSCRSSHIDPKLFRNFLSPSLSPKWHTLLVILSALRYRGSQHSSMKLTLQPQRPRQFLIVNMHGSMQLVARLARQCWRFFTSSVAFRQNGSGM